VHGVRSPRARRRLVPPAMTAVLVVAASCGLAVLQLGAGGPRPDLVQPGRDPLALPYLRAFVSGQPGDAAMRLRLGREEVALGLLDDADRTLAPLLAGDRASSEAVALAFEVSLAAWRAARSGTPDRARAHAHALARLESLLERGAALDLLTRVAAAARELGRPDLAARAEQRAAVVDGERCAAWLARAARDALAAGDPAGAAASRRGAYECERDGAGGTAGGAAAAHRLAIDALDAHIAADRGADALAFAGELAARFPDDPQILGRAMAVALANGAPERARQFAVRLRDTGAAEPAVLERLLDLDLAARDLPGAWRTAERLVARAPDDPGVRRLAGRVADWAALPRPALAHWMWLARRGDPDGRDRALRLAHALDDDAAVAALLTDDARRRPLGAEALGELAAALERLGSPGRAVALLEGAARDATDDAPWEQLVAFHERRRDLPAAIAARTELARRLGPSLPRSLRLAKLAWAAGRADAALAELGDWSARTGAAETEYWQLVAELAWQQESDELAERAYRAIWDGGAIDALAAERLVVLARDAGRPADAIRYGRDGWARVGEPRLLLLAMDDAARAGRWNDVERLRRDAQRDEPRFADSLAYWLLCAQLDARRGRTAEAARDYRRALALDAGSPAARAGLLWLLIDTDDREALAVALDGWAADAEDDPRLWRPYAVGLERLGRARDALAFYRREADADPADAGARGRYLAAVRRGAPAAATPAAASRATVLTAELGATTLGPAVLRRLGAAARTDVRDIALEVRSQLTQVSADDPMLRLDRRSIDLLAGAALGALGGRAELFGGANLQGDGAVPRAAGAYSRAIARAQVRVEAALNELAPESAVLLAEAVRARAAASLALGWPRFYARAVGEWRTWSTRSGTWLARGAAGTFELGVHARLANPALDVRLSGGYQRNEVAMPEPGAPPLLPATLATLGIGLSAARWQLGPVRLLLDAWLGEQGPPRRVAYRLHSGLAIEPFTGAELSLAGYVANDNLLIENGEVGLTASLAYRIPHSAP
jgi:tetratricopeptide (TPR) repeat protein